MSVDQHLNELEAEAIFILRETYAEFKNPVILYSVGKDSGVLAHLAQKAFYPASVPISLLHVDTGYKFPEMYTFRESFVKKYGLKLRVYRNEKWIGKLNPFDVGTDACCKRLKTEALLNAIKEYKVDAAIGGARRDEEKSRAKERIYSHRDRFGQWNPKKQRPELWNLFNPLLSEGETMRVFPLSNWTEGDVWNYVRRENIPVVPLYFAKRRKVVDVDGVLIPVEYKCVKYPSTLKAVNVVCRFRTLGCIPCTGAVRSRANTIGKIIDEVGSAKKSERQNRIIDLNSESSMEKKKKEGYF